MAPNIYYLGASNVVRFGPLRIAGLSGIWKGYNYNKSHHERLPYSPDDVKSIYHVRELDVRKLLQVRTQVDVGVSHDWPRGVEWMGDWRGLFAKKDLFEADARAGTLGSSAAKYVLDRLRPPYWFSAHLHCKFSAVVNHAKVVSLGGQPRHDGGCFAAGHEDLAQSSQVDVDLDSAVTTEIAVVNDNVRARNDNEIDLDMEDDEKDHTIPHNTIQSSSQAETPQLDNEAEIVLESVRAQLPASFTKPISKTPVSSVSNPPEIFSNTTQFLALDKCLPHRKFLQILSIEPINEPTTASSPTSDSSYHLSYDKEWLAITRAFASDLTLGEPSSPIPPNKGEAFYLPLIIAEEQWVGENLEKTGRMRIPENFESTAPIYDPIVGIGTGEQPREYTSPQTVAFCELIGIENKFAASEEEREARKLRGPNAAEMTPFSGRMRGGGRGFRGHGGDRGRGRGGGRGRGRGANLGRGRGG